jgi:hypothetical protein
MPKVTKLSKCDFKGGRAKTDVPKVTKPSCLNFSLEQLWNGLERVPLPV